MTSLSSASVTSVNSSATNVTLVSSNIVRQGLILFNDSSQTVYVKFGATASSSDYTFKILAGGYYESPGDLIYTGRIDAIWASANGSMKITELF